MCYSNRCVNEIVYFPLFVQMNWIKINSGHFKNNQSSLIQSVFIPMSELVIWYLQKYGLKCLVFCLEFLVLAYNYFDHRHGH